MIRDSSEHRRQRIWHGGIEAGSLPEIELLHMADDSRYTDGDKDNNSPLNTMELGRITRLLPDRRLFGKSDELSETGGDEERFIFFCQKSSLHYLLQQ